MKFLYYVHGYMCLEEHEKKKLQKQLKEMGESYWLLNKGEYMLVRSDIPLRYFDISPDYFCLVNGNAFLYDILTSSYKMVGGDWNE